MYLFGDDWIIPILEKNNSTKHRWRKHVIPLNPGSWQNSYSVSAQSLWNKRIFHSLQQTMEDWSPQRWIWWKKRGYFFGCIPGTPRPTIYQWLFQSDDFKLVGWGSRYKFHENLRPLFVGIHGNPFKTWSPRSNTNFDKSWMFWRCHDASADIFMFFTAPKPVGVPYLNPQGMVKNHTRFSETIWHPNWKVKVYVMIHSLISIFHYLWTNVV